MLLIRHSTIQFYSSYLVSVIHKIAYLHFKQYHVITEWVKCIQETFQLSLVHCEGFHE